LFSNNLNKPKILGLSSEIQKSIKAEVEKLYEDSKDRALLAQIQSKSTQNNTRMPSETLVFPFLQMGAFKIDQEIQLLSRLFTNQVYLNQFKLTIKILKRIKIWT
jgi:hypothetical protein